MATLEHPWSTMVRIASFPLCFGKPVIRSMATCWNGRVFSLVVIWYKGVCFLWVRILFY